MKAAEPRLEDRLLEALVQGVEAEIGEGFFRSLVRTLAETLGVAYAFLSELTQGGTHFRTFALFARGAFVPNVEVPLDGTPCEAVLQGEWCFHPDRLQELFPRDTVLVDWRARSYGGVPMLDSKGRVVGHLAFVHDEPLADGAQALAVMRIFAKRAVAEIERLRVEQAFRESEERLASLVENATDGILSYDASGRIVVCNASAARILRSSEREVVGSSIWRFSTEEGRLATEAVIAQLERDPRARVYAGPEAGLRGTRADGTSYAFEATLSRGEARGQAFYTVIFRDLDERGVQERELAELRGRHERLREALRGSQALTASILESASDAILSFDEAGSIVFLNPSAARVLRVAAEATVGTSMWEFSTESGRPVVEAVLGELAKNPKARIFISEHDGVHVRRADGSTFPAESSVFRADLGGKTYYTTIFRDLDERSEEVKELARLRSQSEYLREELRQVHNFEEIVGRSPALAKLLGDVELVAGTETSVLIQGETGTGKELIARAIHARSRRAGHPLVKLNCAAIPAGLVESELFGHEKGAFTGATDRRVGRFELAAGGTLFLDEIGELPLETQAKLLRVLQEREFERVGSNRTQQADVRVIAATNRDLPAMVAAGRFRPDLFYRLSVFPVLLPPLRERPEDIPLLASFFIARQAPQIGRAARRLSERAAERLLAYAWPGNVRELENVIERALILASPEASELEVPEALLLTAPAAALRDPARPAAPARPAPDGDAEPPSLEEVERRHIEATLRAAGWKIEGAEGAARRLGLQPSTLRSRMKKLGIQRDARNGP
jgi:PAS domain S-box-containing protein